MAFPNAALVANFLDAGEYPAQNPLSHGGDWGANWYGSTIPLQNLPASGGAQPASGSVGAQPYVTQSYNAEPLEVAIAYDVVGSTGVRTLGCAFCLTNPQLATLSGYLLSLEYAFDASTVTASISRYTTGASTNILTGTVTTFGTTTNIVGMGLSGGVLTAYHVADGTVAILNTVPESVYTSGQIGIFVADGLGTTIQAVYAGTVSVTVPPGIDPYYVAAWARQDPQPVIQAARMTAYGASPNPRI